MKLKTLILVLLFVLNIPGKAQDIDNDSNACIAVQVTDKITVDGDLSEWDKSHPLSFNKEEQVNSMGLWNGWDDFSSTAYIMWDSENLYVSAEVVDDMPFRFLNAPEIDGVDCLVVYINTNENENCDRDLNSSTDFKVLIALDNNRFPTAIDRNSVLLKKGFQTEGMNKDRNVFKDIEIGIKETNSGYNFELKLPFKVLANKKLPVLKPIKGMNICFNLQFIDLDEASDDEIDSIGDRVSFINFFPGNPELKPRDWGYLKLL